MCWTTTRSPEPRTTFIVGCRSTSKAFLPNSVRPSLKTSGDSFGIWKSWEPPPPAKVCTYLPLELP